MSDVYTPTVSEIRKANRVRELAKMSRAALKAVTTAKGIDYGRGFTPSKDELVADILEAEGLR